MSDYFKREGLFDRDTDDSYTPEERLALYRLAAKTIEGEAPHVGTYQNWEDGKLTFKDVKQQCRT